MRVTSVSKIAMASLLALSLGCTGGTGGSTLVDAGASSPDGAVAESCPSNSSPVEKSSPLECACDEGYVFDESGGACEMESGNACPEHSSPFEENGQSGCRCDEGYVANPAGNACVRPADACPENSSYFEEGMESGCRCDEGYVVNAAGNGCEASQSCPAGNPKAVVNGVVILCCPSNAEGVQLSGGVWSCTCAEGASYDAELNQCL